MDWKDLASVVGRAAPILGTLVGGPAGGAIGGIIASVLGTDNSPGAVYEALKTDPAAIVKLKQLESDERVKFQEMAYAAANAEFAKEVEDRASARQREMAVQDRTPATLAFLVTFGFFGVLGWLLYAGKPPNGGDALLVMLGALGGAWGTVIAYYFGSTKGSAEKTRLLANHAPPK